MFLLVIVLALVLDAVGLFACLRLEARHRSAVAAGTASASPAFPRQVLWAYLVYSFASLAVWFAVARFW